MNEHAVDGPLAKRHARGNTFADVAATLGVEAHPVLARGDTSVEAYARKLRRVALTSASTCRLWPKSSVTNGVLRRLARETVQPKRMHGEPEQSTSSSKATPIRMQPDPSHYMLTVGGIEFCGICGSYSTVRLSPKLVAPCKRRAGTAQAKRQRNALTQNRHPVTGTTLCVYKQTSREE